jgi:hypothetical protein
MTDFSWNEGRRAINPFWPAAALLAVILFSQSLNTWDLLNNRFNLGQLQDQAQAQSVKIAALDEQVKKKSADIRRDQQMAVDLSRVLVSTAQAGNKTAQSLVPAMRHDLDQLQLAIKLDGGSAPSPTPAAPAGPAAQGKP